MYANKTELRTPYDRHHDGFISFLRFELSPDELSSLWLASVLAFSAIIAYALFKGPNSELLTMRGGAGAAASSEETNS